MVSLEQRVAETSQGQFRLIDTPDRGRCLEAAVDIPAGHRIRDLPILPHGSSVGKHLAAATASNADIKSVDLLAALDFLASMAFFASEADLLMSLYQFEGKVPKVPMIRHWHKKWNLELAEAVEIPFLEQAWAHVVPNWRQLTVSVPSWRSVEIPAGTCSALTHDIVCGLWLHMALCEHSCDPNCALLHDGEDLWFTALRPICAGSAITTSYLNLGGLLKPQAQRQQELMETWGFHCACTRCKECVEDCEDKDLEMLLASCSSPPPTSEQKADEEYSQKLRQLQRKVRELHGAISPSPSELALLLLEAIFAPKDLQQDACRRHHEACRQLWGESSQSSQWAEALLESPAGCLGCLGLEEAWEGEPRDCLRQAYALHFASRRWGRRRRGAQYVAWTDELQSPATSGGYKSRSLLKVLS